MNDQNNQIQTETLSDKVKAARSQARDILRMRMINTRLAKIYDLNTTENEYKKEIEKANKRLKITVYEQNKRLDEAHPDFENINKNVEENIKTETEYTESIIKDYEASIEVCKEEVKKLENEITEIEVGEKKVNIEEVNELAREIINKI